MYSPHMEYTDLTFCNDSNIIFLSQTNCCFTNTYKHFVLITANTNKSAFPVYTSTLCQTQTSYKPASSLWCTDTPDPDYCYITINLLAFRTSAACSHSDCLSCFLNFSKKNEKDMTVREETCSCACSMAWQTHLFTETHTHQSVGESPYS